MTGAVTFSKLGDHGQFGNQLFQIAAVLGHAAKHGARPCLPPWRCDVTGMDYQAEFPGITRYCGTFPGGEVYREPSFAYAEIPPIGNIDLVGNFQCERYFVHCAEEIRTLFAEPPAIRAPLDDAVAAMGPEGFAAVHVRFYAHPSRDTGKGPMEALPLGYLAAALRRLGEDLPIFVATDNRRLLAAALRLVRPDGRVIVTEFDNPLLDFFMLARARRIAISNSSFSWWAAWLGAAKERIIAPHRYFWFNREVRQDPFWTPHDLYPPNFEEIAW